MTALDPAEIGVGMLGAGSMGRAHAHAYRALANAPGAPVLPRLVALAGRPGSVDGPRHGFPERVAGWRALVEDPRVAVFDKCGSNDLHQEPTVAAAEAGRHVICEKPLGRSAAEAYDVWRRVEAAGVRHMCAFNYRFVPAIRFARELVQEGEGGEVRHFRARFLQNWLLDPRARRELRAVGVTHPFAIACANGWRGYLPPGRAFAEGGCEVGWARRTALAASLEATVVERIVAAAGC